MKKLLLLFILYPFSIFAADYDNDLRDLINSEMKQWAQRDIVIDAIKRQNELNVDLSPSDMKVLNNKWHSEKRKTKKPLTKRVLENELSEYLRQIQEGGEGVYTEIIVTDNKGINAGQSRLSENYWQGESEGWKKTFESRSYTTYISDLSFNDNTELFQLEVSFMITDNEEPIGMVYAGIDVEQLENWKKSQEAAR